MEKDERILLVVAFIALVALVIARFRSGGSIGEPSIGQTNLTYNQPAFMFSAPVANVLPDNAVQAGTADAFNDDFMYSDCGCY